MTYPIASDAVTKAFQNLGNEWALVAFGEENHFNAITVSWGSLGFIWKRPIVTVMVRPQRYTWDFSEKYRNFSVSFYRPEYHNALSVMGSLSGRDTDKIAQAGLTPVFVGGVPTFKEAYLTVTARTVYRGQLEESGFRESSFCEEYYPQKDYHTLYHGELLHTYDSL